MNTVKPESVEQYIAGFAPEIQAKLQEIRAIIRAAAPLAEECISYQMPAYKYRGMLVYFAGYNKHIGFYPTGSGIKAFADRFGSYKWSKGAVQFPLHQPLPAALIQEIVHFRLMENEAKPYSKKKEKS